nr:DUF4795 domain-containing protein [Allomuricauda sp.]
MKIKITLVVAFLLGGLTWGQENSLQKFRDAIEKHDWKEDNNSKQFFLRLLDNELDKKRSILERDEHLTSLLNVLESIEKLNDAEKLDKKLIDYLKKELKKKMRMLNRSYSTGETYDIEIDFGADGVGLSRDIAVPRKIKKGDFYRVIVNDINLNRYSVLIKNEDSLKSTSIALPTFESLSLDALTQLTSGFLTNPTIALQKIITDDSTVVELSNIKAYKALETDFENANTISSVIIEQMKNMAPTNPEEAIKKIIEEEKTTLANAGLGLSLYNQKFDEIKFEVYKRRLNLFKKLPDNSDDKIDFAESLIEIDGLRKIVKEFQTELKKAQSNFLDALKEGEIPPFLENPRNVTLKKEVDKLKTIYTSTLTKTDEFIGLISADNMEKLLKSILFLELSNVYRSLPIQFKGDIEELSISFVPKDSTSGLQTETLTPLVFPIENQWYWSVGTSFYYSNLSNERFFTTASTNGENTVYSYKQIESTSREAGIATMLRAGLKLGDSPIGLHLGIGPGISIENNVRPRLLFGGGFSIGRKHNLTIDYGGILGYVDRFVDGIDTSGSGLNEQPNPLNTEILVVNYISLGYMYKL